MGMLLLVSITGQAACIRLGVRAICMDKFFRSRLSLYYWVTPVYVSCALISPELFAEDPRSLLVASDDGNGSVILTLTALMHDFLCMEQQPRFPYLNLLSCKAMTIDCPDSPPTDSCNAMSLTIWSSQPGSL